MDRRRQIRSLSVWMNGEPVGVWSRGARHRHEFRYAVSWLDSPEARPLSLSIPLVAPGYAYSGEVIEAYFDNLLPDSTEIRQRIRQRFSAESLSAFDLLAEVGRDCVGAIQLLPQGEEPRDVRRIASRPLTEEDVESVLKGVTTVRMGRGSPGDAFRISIAGAQEKTALLRLDGRWMEPLGTTPTTHILKLPLGRIGGMGIDLGLSIENEWLCSRLAKALGFPIAPCELLTFGETRALVVERFDRRRSADGAWILRLPQEDFCQATGTPPDRKYEADGGPGIATIMRILLGAREPFRDRQRFMKSQLLFWLLAAPDGHAKNFSLFLGRGGRFGLTPLYDIISAYPFLGSGPGRIDRGRLRMAMAVSGKNRHYEWDRIQYRHWRETAARCGFTAEIEEAVREIVDGVSAAVCAVSAELPPDFPDSVASPILEGVQAAAARLGA